MKKIDWKGVGLAFIVISILVGSFILSAYSQGNSRTNVVLTITPAPTVKPIHLDEYKIYDLINNYRDVHGLSELVFDPSMCKFTSIRLNQVHSDWSHNGFLPEVRQYYHYVYAGENLARGESDEKSMVIDWIKSPEHLANIMNTHYTRTCIATDTLDNWKTYAVQEFASN